MSMTSKLVQSLTYVTTPDKGMGNFTNLDTVSFFAAVTKAIPNSYLIRKGQREAWVCHPRDPMTLGYVGHDEYLGDMRFAVFSRSIENGRFSGGTAQNKMLASKDLAVAVRNAKKHLRPHSVSELAALGASDVAALMRGALSEYSSRRGIAQRCFSDEALRTELEIIVNSSYEFQNTRVKADLMEYFAANRAYQQANNTKRSVVFAHVTEDWRGQIVRVQAMSGASGGSFYAFSPAPAAVSYEFPVSEVEPDTEPYTIVGRISVLSMIEMNKFVEGVGVKTSESTYYVEL